MLVYAENYITKPMFMKKIKSILVLLMLVGAHSVSAQYQLGFYNSNYGGLSSMMINPANAADNRMRFQLFAGSAGFNFSNNYLMTNTPYSYFDLTKAALKDPNAVMDSFQGVPVWQESYLQENINGKDKSVNLSTEVMGPGFYTALGKKMGLAFHTKVKTALQVNGISEPLARLARYSLKYPTLNNQFHADTKFGLNVNSYAEMGVTLGRVIIENEQHYLKAGVTVKSLRGLYSMYLQNKGVNINFPTSDSLVLTQDEIEFGYVKEQYYGVPGNSRPINDVISGLFDGSIAKGLGYDFGVVYEFRPEWSKYYEKMDNQMRWKQDQNKYLYKISASLVDVGGINYSNSDWVRNYKLRLLGNSDTIRWGHLDTLGIASSTSFSNAVGKVIKYTDSSTAFRVGLPTTFNLNFDYRVAKHVYVSGTWVQSLRKGSDIAMRTPSMLAVQPRVEWKYFEVALPLLSAFDYTKFQIGAYLRVGPVFVGSDNIGGFFGKTTFNGLDFYAGAAIPLYYHKWKDKDHDGVSNKKDLCDKEKGTWEMKGCPDKDGDLIGDKEDQCPDVAGTKAMKGCPDTDKDGIADAQDKCPTVAGKKELMGCPDSDNDGITDAEDQCPTVAGLAYLMGCPDTDKDSIADAQDKCPTIAGKKSLMGCPDTDNDGVADADDRCPTEAGTAKTNGCPDTDKDGIADKDDRCPTVAGLAAFKGCKDSDLDGISDPDDKCPNEFGTKENNGCPLVKPKETVVSANLDAEEQDVLKKAFDALTFETGKAIIDQKSVSGLDTLAALLLKRPEYFIMVTGHTDNEGGQAKNQALSLSRAQEVKTYLVSKGVAANRIVTKGYGSSAPVAPNDTQENKRKNRRVELKVYKP